MNIRQDEFDARLRHCHAQSLQQLSPRVQAQLALRRRPSTTQHRAGWIAAISMAAALVLVVGLQFRPQPDRSTPPAAVGQSRPVVSAQASATEPDDGSAYAAYDENPDFYLWLASSDATTLASE